MLQAIERYMKQAIVDKVPSVSSSALVSSLVCSLGRGRRGWGQGLDWETEETSESLSKRKKKLCIPRSESPTPFSVKSAWGTLGQLRGQLDSLDPSFGVTDFWNLSPAGSLPGQGE